MRDLEPIEIWKPIQGYEGWYSASNEGRIRRDKQVPGARAGRILRPGHSRGYQLIVLSKNGKPHTFSGHKLIALAFLGPRPPGYDINHKDGNRNNNNVSNLEYLTRKENAIHAFDVLRSRGGEKHAMARLAIGTVRAIQNSYSTTRDTFAEIGRRFGVSTSHTRRIALRKVWKYA